MLSMNLHALTPKMYDVVMQMQEHGSLVRLMGGFWTWKDCPAQHIARDFRTGQKYPVPTWHCTIGTVRALAKRQFVQLLDNETYCELIYNERTVLPYEYISKTE